MMRDIDDGSAAGLPRASFDLPLSGGPASIDGRPFSSPSLSGSSSLHDVARSTFSPLSSSIDASSPVPAIGGSQSELQTQMAKDMERLRRISSHLSSTRSWAEQYADEASALSALAKGAALAQAEPLFGPTDRLGGWSFGSLSSCSGVLGSMGSVSGAAVVEESYSRQEPLNYPAPPKGFDMPEPTMFNESASAPRSVGAATASIEGSGGGNGAGGKPTRGPSSSSQDKSGRENQLKQKFIQAQKALDERARKLKDALSKERERLKAYQSQLQQTAKEIDEKAQMRRRELEAEYTAKVQMLERKHAEVLRQKSVVDHSADARIEQIERGASSMQIQLEEKGRILAIREAQLEQTLSARRAEIEREMAGRQAQIDARQRVLAERETEIERRISARLAESQREITALQAQVEAKQAELMRREAQFDASAQVRLTEIERDAAGRQASIEAKERALQQRQSQLEQAAQVRLAEIERDAVKRQTEFEAKQRAWQQRHAEMEQGATVRLDLIERGATNLSTQIESREHEITQRETALKARHTELEQSYKQKFEQLDREATARRADYESKKRMLAERETALRGAEQTKLAQIERDTAARTAELDRRERELNDRKAQVEAKVKSRVDEALKETAATQKQLKERVAALSEHEVEVQARRDAVEKECDAKELELRARAKELADLIQSERNRISEEAMAARQKLGDAVSERETELNALREELAERELAITQRESATAQFKASMEEREAALEAAVRELARKADEVTRRATDVAAREDEGRAWQKRTAETEKQLSAAKQAVDEQQRAAERAHIEAREAAARLENEAQTLGRQKSEMAAQKDSIDAQIAELKGRGATIDEKAKELDAIRREIETRAEQLSEERTRYKQVEKFSQEAQEQKKQADARSAEVVQGEAALRRRIAEFEEEAAVVHKARGEMESARRSLEVMESDLKGREAKLEAGKTALAEAESRVRDIEDAQDVERRRLASAQTQAAASEKELSRLQKDLESQKARLSETQAAISRERDTLTEQQASLHRQQTIVQQDCDRLAEERSAYEHSRTDLDREKARLVQDHQELEARQSQIQSERTEIDRVKATLRERERAAAEERSCLAASRNETEDDRKELTRRIAETEDLRRQLMEKYERQREKKARLATDAATVDARLKTLAGEMEAVKHDRQAMAQEREALDRERRQLAADRVEVARQRDELRHAQLGGSESGPDAEVLTAREVAFEERVRELDAVQSRLNQQEEEIARARREIAAAQRQHEDSALGMSSIMERTQAMADQLRQREAALTAREKDIATRASELDDAHRRTQRETESLEIRRRQLEREAEALELGRREFESVVETQGQAVERLREESQAQISDERAGRDRSNQGAAENSQTIKDEPPFVGGAMTTTPGLETPTPRVSAGTGGKTPWVTESDDWASDEAIDSLRDLQSVKPTGVWKGQEDYHHSSSRRTIVASEPSPVGSRPFGLMAIVMMGLLIGGAVATAFVWSPSREVLVRGRMSLTGINAGAMTAQEHAAAILRDSALLKRTATASGVDLAQLQREGRIEIKPASSGTALDIIARVPTARQEAVQQGVNALGQAYAASIGTAANTHTQIQERLARLEADQKSKGRELQREQEMLAELESKLQITASSGNETVKPRKAALKTQMAAALEAVNHAKKELADNESTPAGQEKTVPSDEQLAQAYAADEELTQAVEQQTAKAEEFHRTLSDAIEKPKEPMAALVSSIEEIEAKVREQIKDQTDTDIQRELEQIAADLATYHDQTDRFAAAWEDLVPKLEGWQSGADPAMLLEYQNRAETLVRDYYGSSRLSFSAAADRADTIGREGSEMTKRRIIQNSLQRLAHQSLDARNAWIVAARAVVPRYNVELKANRDSVHDLAPRIEELKDRQKAKLARQLAETRGDQRKKQIAQLQAAVDEAARHYQELSDEFLMLDSQATVVDEKAAALVQQLKRQTQEKRDHLAALQAESKELDEEIVRVQDSGTVSPPGVASYASLDSVLSPSFNMEKKDRALGFGGLAAGLFILLAWGRTLQKRNRAPALIQR